MESGGSKFVGNLGQFSMAINNLLKKGNNWNEPLKKFILEASSVDKIASSKNLEEIKRFFKKIGTNHRLLDKKIVFEWKEPWNILTFSEDTLRNLYGAKVRSTENNFQKNTENSVELPDT